jgi:hypothetical protein
MTGSYSLKTRAGALGSTLDDAVIVAEHLQFAMNPRRPPQWIGNNQAPYQLANFDRCSGPPSPTDLT